MPIWHKMVEIGLRRTEMDVLNEKSHVDHLSGNCPKCGEKLRNFGCVNYCWCCGQELRWSGVILWKNTSSD